MRSLLTCTPAPLPSHLLRCLSLLPGEAWHVFLAHQAPRNDTNQRRVLDLRHGRASKGSRKYAALDSSVHHRAGETPPLATGHVRYMCAHTGTGRIVCRFQRWEGPGKREFLSLLLSRGHTHLWYARGADDQRVSTLQGLCKASCVGLRCSACFTRHSCCCGCQVEFDDVRLRQARREQGSGALLGAHCGPDAVELLLVCQQLLHNQATRAPSSTSDNHLANTKA